MICKWCKQEIQIPPTWTVTWVTKNRHGEFQQAEDNVSCPAVPLPAFLHEPMDPLVVAVNKARTLK